MVDLAHAGDLALVGQLAGGAFGFLCVGEQRAQASLHALLLQLL